MTNQEAIEIIKSAQAQIEWSYPMDYAVAFDMAISALQAQELSEIQKATDTVSRQAAIDAFDCTDELIVSGEANAQNVAGYINKVIGKIEALPPAQPEIIRCMDCKHYYYADNRIPQEQRYTCDLDGDRWSADSFCSFAERREDE